MTTAPAGALGPRAAPSRAEAAALAVVAVAVVAFALHGYLASVPSTTSYLATVVALGALVVLLRREPLPDLLAYGLALDAVAHLSGGLVRVGHGVLYNAAIDDGTRHLGTHVFQYDHLVHAYGSFIGAITIWVVLVRPMVVPTRPARVAVVCLLAGLGVGALNEMVEFIVTLVNSGSHVGGYTNTGWDLVANAVGGTAAGLVVWRWSRQPVTP